MIEPSPFSLWLRRRRRIFDLTQADLAQAIGCSVSAVRKLESGDLLPSAEMTNRLAARLAVPAGQLAAFSLFVRGAPNNFPADEEAPAPPPPPAPGHPPPKADSPIHNIPVPFTSLVGREENVTSLVARLRLPGTRLLTLTGPPGSGKTRLAIAVAAALAGDFADGIHFASLAPISDPALLFSSLARGLGLVEATDRRDSEEFPRLRALADFLRARHFLLVLDNFEHLLAAAPALSFLLQSAPELKILTTSREVLHLYGESEIPVLPLPLPSFHPHSSGEDISSIPAVQLFVERAQAVQPYFALTRENQATVAQICVGLDGLPLALEMAAAQLKWQPVELIARQLADLRLNLQRTWRDADPRQQTLRGAIEWSYRLLPPAEQRLFARLGAFVGGCSEEAVEALQHALEKSAPTLFGPSTGDLLRGLVERSLLQLSFDGRGEARYTFLETIREYALERLAAGGEMDAVRQQLAHWFLAFAQEGERELYGPQAKVWLERLESEHDNFRAILAAFVAGQRVDSESALQLVVALSRFWNHRGHWAEGERWMRLVLERGTDGSEVGRALVLRHLASLLVNRGERLAARQYAAESLSILRRINRPFALADTLYILGFICLLLDEYDQAQAHLEEALGLLNGKDAPHSIAQNVLNSLGYLMNCMGNFPQAGVYGRALLELARHTGDRNATGNALNNLGETAFLQEEFVFAIDYFEDSLRQAQENNSLSARAYRLPNLGFAFLRQKIYDRSFACFQEALALSHRVGGRVICLRCCVGLALAGMATGKIVYAATLAGAIPRLLDMSGLHFTLIDQIEYNQLVTELQSQWEQPTIAAAWAMGQSMTLDEAVAFAQSLAPAPAQV